MADSRTVDLGIVLQGGASEQCFEIANTTSESFRITSVTSSCYCHRTNLVEGLEVRAGETLPFHFAVSTLDAGLQVARLTVGTDHDRPEFRNMQFSVRALVQSVIECRPATVDFGSVQLGASAERTVSVNVSEAASQLVFEDASVSKNQISVTAKPSSGSVQVRLTFQPEAEAFDLDDHLVVRYRNNEGVEVRRIIPVRGTASPIPRESTTQMEVP